MEETEWNKKIKNFTDRINDANLLGQENKHFVCDKIWGWKNLKSWMFDYTNCHQPYCQ